jgi:hypothetical protein
MSSESLQMKWIPLASAIVLLASCQSKVQSPPANQSEAEAAPVARLQFDGRSWMPTGEMSQALPIFLPAAVLRSDGFPGRLLHVVDDEATGTSPREVFRMENQAGGQWIQDGTTEIRAANGQRDVWHHANGKQHGPQEKYFSSGRLRIREEYEQGVLHGMSEVWDESGKLLLKCRYDYGQETVLEDNSR